jgi:hypothetical protein
MWDLVAMLAWSTVAINPEVGKIKKGEQWELAAISLDEIIANLPKKAFYVETIFQYLPTRSWPERFGKFSDIWSHLEDYCIKQCGNGQV